MRSSVDTRPRMRDLKTYSVTQPGSLIIGPLAMQSIRRDPEVRLLVSQFGYLRLVYSRLKLIDPSAEPYVIL